MDCKRKELFIYVGLFLLAALVFGVMTYIKGNNQDFDELFSIALANSTLPEIWGVTAGDVHPPLWYFLLKGYKLFFDYSPEHLYYYRFFSIIGYSISLVLCCFPVRRLWGFKVSVFALIIFIFIPNSFYTYTNIRMYPWAMSFIFGAFIYAYDAYKNMKVAAWCKFCVFAICCMYTHYYALIAAFFIYMFLFFAVLTQKSSRKPQLIKYGFCGFISVLVYIPWLYNLYSQLQFVNEGFWFVELSLTDILFSIQFFFAPKYYTEVYGHIFSQTWFLVIIPVLLALVLFISILALKNRKEYREYVRVGVVSFFLFATIFVVIIAYSYFVSPAFNVRYLSSFLGLFVLGLSLFMSVLYDKAGKYKLLIYSFFLLLLIDFLICVCINVKRNGRESLAAFQKNIEVFMKGTDGAFYSTVEQGPSLGLMSVAYPQYKYYLIVDSDSLKQNYNVKPFDSIVMIDTIRHDARFVLITDINRKENPKLENFVAVDSMIGVWYKMVPKDTLVFKEEEKLRK